MEAAFWMVWNVGGNAPRVRHQSEDSARNEAARLARMNPGERFVVLKAVAECEAVKPVQWRELATTSPTRPSSCDCDSCVPF